MRLYVRLRIGLLRRSTRARRKSHTEVQEWIARGTPATSTGAQPRALSCRSPCSPNGSGVRLDRLPENAAKASEERDRATLVASAQMALSIDADSADTMTCASMRREGLGGDAAPITEAATWRRRTPRMRSR